MGVAGSGPPHPPTHTHPPHTTHQVDHVRAERNVLAEVQHHSIVKLCYSFQDEDHLYLVMEYLPGGDMMTLLIRKEILPEAWARFYLAQVRGGGGAGAGYGAGRRWLLCVCVDDVGTVCEMFVCEGC